MIEAEVEWTDRTRTAADGAATGLRRGLLIAGEHVLGDARNRVPIEEATLERSGMVTSAEGTVAVAFDTPYAVRQHEDMTLSHDDGRTAKYLELALAQTHADVLAIIATAVRRALAS